MWIWIALIAAIAISVTLSVAIAAKLVRDIYEILDDRLDATTDVIKTIVSRYKR